MNIQTIKRECMSRRMAVIQDAVGAGQWISDGIAAWPVEGITVDVDGLKALFNLTEKQETKIQMREVAIADPRYARYMMEDEEQSDELGAMLFGDEVFVALKSRRGNLFIPYSSVKHIKEENRFYGIRWAAGFPLVAAYNGFTCAALVLPLSNGWGDVLSHRAEKMAAPRFVWPDEADRAEAAAEAMLNGKTAVDEAVEQLVAAGATAIHRANQDNAEED